MVALVYRNYITIWNYIRIIKTNFYERVGTKWNTKLSPSYVQMVAVNPKLQLSYEYGFVKAFSHLTTFNAS